MKTTLLLALATAALAQTNNFRTVVADIANVRNLTLQLKQAVVAAQPGQNGLITALQINTDTMNVEQAIQKAINDANASGPFGKKGSLKVALSILKLEQPVVNTLNAVVAQKGPFFDQTLGNCIGDVSPIVQMSIQQQKQLSDQLGAALVPKLAPPEASAAPHQQAIFDNAFASAISAYSAAPTCTHT